MKIVCAVSSSESFIFIYDFFLILLLLDGQVRSRENFNLFFIKTLTRIFLPESVF